MKINLRTFLNTISLIDENCRCWWLSPPMKRTEHDLKKIQETLDNIQRLMPVVKQFVDSDK